MSYNIIATPTFERRLKKLAKRHRSLHNDLNKLFAELETNPTMGILIRNDCYKIKMAISSKGKGKSGGARIFTYVRIINKTVYLAELFDKADRDNISEKELDAAFDFVQYLETPTNNEEE